jgi:uncharacterized membrane protein
MAGQHPDEDEHVDAPPPARRPGHPGAEPDHLPDLSAPPIPNDRADGPLYDPGRHLHDLQGHPHEHAYGAAAMEQTLRARLTALADTTLYAIRRHWLAGVNTLLATLIGVAVLVPIGYALGFTGASDAVFHAYRFLCGQTPSHTFYILGYQMCLCTRCLAIYSSLLSGGILLALVRASRRVAGLNWKYWLLAMVPMALDGGTQLFGLRESNLGLRLLTGAIFGLTTAWFLFPQIEDASREAVVVHGEQG